MKWKIQSNYLNISLTYSQELNLEKDENFVVAFDKFRPLCIMYFYSV